MTACRLAVLFMCGAGLANRGKQVVTKLGRRIPSMGSLTIEPVAKTDQPRVIATLVSAFIADPVERWLYPQSLAYLTHFPAFVGAFGGAAFENKTVWALDDFAAVAMWLPPGGEADGDAIVAALTESVSAQKHADTFAVLEQMDAAHPRDHHWYLPWLGADCARQSAGLGSDLLQQCLVRVDADHSLAFLETPTRERFRSTSAMDSE